ncbi:MAG: ABC transporter permease [Methanobacteriaceae archaeon]|jgi:putative ABC transport system permease protein|nr:ABC transporter permease [Candidatus Methanorudis spinitermitis]
MSYLKLILKNPFRKKFKSILTISIITIIIVSIIFLTSLSISGMYAVDKSITAGGDFVVRANYSLFNVEENTFFMNESIVQEIENIEGVEKATPFKEIPSDDDSFIYIRGVTPSTLESTGTKLIEGKFPSKNNEVLIGKDVVKGSDKDIGDRIIINNKTYIVTGIFAGNYLMDSDVFMLPEALNKTTNDVEELGEVDIVVVHISDGSNIESIKNSVNNLHKGKFVAISNFNETGIYKQLYDIINTVTNYLSLSAIIFGGLLTFYVMLSSVNSRVRELGVLKAVGWSNKQVIGMIIGESMVISFVAWIIGAIISVLLIGDVFSNSLYHDIVWDIIWIFLRTLAIVIIIGIIGCLYPAYKASKISPIEALRY